MSQLSLNTAKISCLQEHWESCCVHQTQMTVKSYSISKIRTLICLLSPANSIGPLLSSTEVYQCPHTDMGGTKNWKARAGTMSMNICIVPAKNPSFPTRKPSNIRPGQTSVLILNPPSIHIPLDCNSLFKPIVIPMRLWAVACLQLHTKVSLVYRIRSQ